MHEQESLLSNTKCESFSMKSTYPFRISLQTYPARFFKQDRDIPFFFQMTGLVFFANSIASFSVATTRSKGLCVPGGISQRSVKTARVRP